MLEYMRIDIHGGVVMEGEEIYTRMVGYTNNRGRHRGAVKDRNMDSS